MRKKEKVMGRVQELDSGSEECFSRAQAAMRIEKEKGQMRSWLAEEKPLGSYHYCVAGQLWMPESGQMAQWPDPTPLVASVINLEV